MRVLLVNPNETDEIKITAAAHARNDLVPLGLLYLASHLKKAHDVKVVDMALLNQSVSELPGIIDAFKPDIIGITSIITLWGTVVDLLRTAKIHAPDIITVVGGSNVSKYPAESLSHKEVDYIITGIGQKPFLELCDKLEKKVKRFEIENCYAQGGSCPIYTTVNSKDYHIDNFPFPDRYATPFEHYSASVSPENPTTSMISSMGCPYKCAFCSSRIEQPFQLRDETRVVDEMEEISSMGIRSILFQDELFAVKRQRVITICENILRRGLRLNWSIKARIDSIRPEMLPLMQRAGCSNIHFGIESGNDATLKRMKKGYTVKQVEQTVRLVKESGLSCTGNFMLAYPGEDEKDVLNTIEFATELGLNMTQFNITYAFPMTDLFYEGAAAGRHSGNDPWSEHTYAPEMGEDVFKLYASTAFPQAKLNEFLEIALSRNRTLFDLNKEKHWQKYKAVS